MSAPEEGKSRQVEALKLAYDDCLLGDVRKFMQNTGTKSVQQIQRQFQIGYGRAAILVQIVEKENGGNR